jgi:hypothetical protein
MFQTIRALVFSIWTLISPELARTPDAPVIADALATVAVQDANLPPVFGSHDVDVVLEAVYVAGESGVDHNPRPQSWDAKDLVSCGILQERCSFARTHSLVEQARYWKVLLRAGKKSCPQTPSAPLGGHCKAGQPLADVRMAIARELLREVIRSGSL